MRLPAVVAVAMLAAPPRASAADVRNVLGGTVNPEGIENTTDFTWRWNRGGTSALTRDAHLAVGIAPVLSPAYARAVFWAELSPLSILDLRAGVEPSAYFGTFGTVLTFEQPDEDFGSDRRRARRDQGRAGTGLRLFAGPTLKARVGRMLATVGAEVEWWRLSMPGPYVYEPARDTLIRPDGDWLVRTASAILIESSGGGGRLLRVGLSHALTYPGKTPSNRIHRAGVLATCTLGGRRAGVREPTIVLNVHHYFRDPSKEGDLGALAALTFGL
jgi:hypothetical protein